MSAALKLASAPPTDDPRGPLRLAIAAAEAASDAVAEHDQAIGRADVLVDERRARLEDARAAVEVAADSDAESVALAIRSGAPMPVGKTKGARAAELGAHDDFEAAVAALKTLEMQRNRLAAAAHAARLAVHREANAALLPLIETIMARIQDAEREALTCSHVLSVLTNESPGTDLGSAWTSVPLFMKARAVAKDVAPDLETLHSLRPWRERFEAFREALHSNADQAVPDLP